jgi:hypothetical protein
MPTLTRWFLRAAIFNLVLGLALALVLSIPSLDLSPGWHPVYIHLLVMGWATQMIFGVAYWMFPRRTPLDLTVFDWIGWTCFASMNIGLLFRAIAEPILAVRSSEQASELLVLAALLQLTSVVAFVIQAWPRVAAK